MHNWSFKSDYCLDQVFRNTTLSATIVTLNTLAFFAWSLSHYSRDSRMPLTVAPSPLLKKWTWSLALLHSDPRWSFNAWHMRLPTEGSWTARCKLPTLTSRLPFGQHTLSLLTTLLVLLTSLYLPFHLFLSSCSFGLPYLPLPLLWRI